jgi:predicted transcriptional regulator
MATDVKYRRNENAINTMAKNVRKYRKEQKLTIQELSNIANLEYAQLSKIERGPIYPSSTKFLVVPKNCTSIRSYESY